MTLTLTDLFCGAGGSSTGAISVPGVEVRVASNHWQLAIETHNTNHQDADHICADLSQINPGYFPTTDLLWASPECTNHSRAKGRKRDTLQTELWQETLPDEAAERSRATMWDVVRFTEHHRYQAVIVENVVEIADWLPYRGWLLAMDSLGYRAQVVSLNSMHAQHRGLPAPQSRDRVYVVFTRKTNPRPDLDGMQRPKAYCPTCDTVVAAVQAWKKPDRDPMKAGRYRSQYVYRCPSVTCRNQVVEPAWLPAASIIDWSLTGQRIGDRDRPLAAKTRARIAAGIARYWRPLPADAAASLAVPVEGRAGQDRVANVGTPLRTQSTRLETALAQPPFVAELRGGGSTARPAGDPLATVTASGNHHGLVQPPFVLERRHEYRTRGVDEPLSTITANDTTKALITSYYGNNDGAQPTDVPLPTVTSVHKHALIMTNTHGNRARPVDEPAPTVTTAGGGGHALLTPAGGTWNDTAYPDSQPTRTMTTRETTALVMRNNTGGPEMVTPATEPMRTVTTAGHQSVLHPGDLEVAEAQVDDVFFRMLEPSECKRAMAFPADYAMLGNRREQVRLAGNAVTPPAARDLIACVIDSLAGTR